MAIKKAIKTAKGMGSMYKEFHDAWKSRKSDYKKYVGNTGKKK
tara:strand:- start:249 stop:377 length:129 start_codon:yes stop_codon:yes gene_type:complete